MIIRKKNPINHINHFREININGKVDNKLVNDKIKNSDYYVNKIKQSTQSNNQMKVKISGNSVIVKILFLKILNIKLSQVMKKLMKS